MWESSGAGVPPVIGGRLALESSRAGRPPRQPRRLPHYGEGSLTTEKRTNNSILFHRSNLREALIYSLLVCARNWFNL